MSTMRRSSRPLLTYVGAVTVCFAGTWGVTAAEARRTPVPPAQVATIRAGAVVIEAEEPLPSPDSLAALLIDRSRPLRGRHGQTAMLRDVIAMTDQIWSMSERAEVLEEIAELPMLDTSLVSALARIAGRISSPAQRATVLETLMQRHTHAVGGSRRAVLDAIRTTPSTTTQASLLRTFVSRPRLSQPALIDALGLIARLPSGERSYVLRAAAQANRIEGRARTLYVQAAMSLETRSQRSRALSAIGARYGSNEHH